MPLRSAYFDDFKGDPTLLLWGDVAGMRELHIFLTMLTTGGSGSLSTIAVDRRQIAVKVAKGDAGIRIEEDSIQWNIDPAMIESFAEKVQVLALRMNGHQYLEHGGPDEIPVTVSVGECPDNLHPEQVVATTKH
jgi:hypothetical protein